MGKLLEWVYVCVCEGTYVCRRMIGAGCGENTRQMRLYPRVYAY